MSVDAINNRIAARRRRTTQSSGDSSNVNTNRGRRRRRTSGSEGSGSTSESGSETSATSRHRGRTRHRSTGSNGAAATESTVELSAAARRELNGSDVHLQNQADAAEARAEERAQARAEGRTVEHNGELVNPSDVRLYRAADEAREREEAHAEGRTYNYNGEWIDPSDVHLYRAAEEAEERAAGEVGQTDAPQDADGPPSADGEEPFGLAKGAPDNPDADHNATDVTVTPWDGVDGQPNDSVVTILRNQGYTDEQIWEANADGKNLVQLVGETNELDEDYTIHPGDELVVPTTHEPTPEEPQTTNEADHVDELGTDGNDEISVNGKGGDDVINATTGKGEDRVELQGGSGDDEINVNTGAGRDNVEVNAGTGHDDINVDLRDGDNEVGDEGRIRGGAGNDTVNVRGDGQGTVSWDSENNQNVLEYEDGTRVVLDGVETVNLNGNGDESETYVNVDGRLVRQEDTGPPTNVPDEPTGEPSNNDDNEQPEMTDRQAVGVLRDNYRWIADPENGDADNGDGARLDDEGLGAVADGSWNREAYMENITGSVNPETGELYTEEYATEQADRFETAAERVLGNEGLRNVIDGGDDNDTNAQDQKIDFEDLQNGERILGDEAQGHLETVNNYGSAMVYANSQNRGDADRLYRDDLERIRSLADSDDFADFLEGGVDRDTFRRNNPEAYATYSNIIERLPEDADHFEAIEEMASAADYFLDGDNFDHISAANGTHENERRDGDYLSLSGDINVLV